MGPATNYIWAYQWDVTGFEVESFSATWSTVAAHDLTFGARLDQSTAYSAVPEPGTWLLIGLGVLIVVLMRRQMSARAATGGD